MKFRWRSIRNRHPKIEFVAALAVASFFTIIRGRFRWRMVPTLVDSVFLKAERVRPIAYYSRNAYCKRCPIFYEPLRTCGTPRKGDDGCWCHTPTKNLGHANCWAYDNGKDYGWPAMLNSVVDGELNESIEADKFERPS